MSEASGPQRVFKLGLGGNLKSIECGRIVQNIGASFCDKSN